MTATLQTINLGNASEQSQYFKIEKFEGRRIFPPLMFRTKWREGGESLQAGQRWQLKVSLRPVHSLLNEGGFDAQR